MAEVWRFFNTGGSAYLIGTAGETQCRILFIRTWVGGFLLCCWVDGLIYVGLLHEFFDRLMVLCGWLG